MEARIKSVIHDLYHLEDFPNQALQALVNEGFDEDTIKCLAYEDWKELISEKIIPIPRAFLFKIKRILDEGASDKQSLSQASQVSFLNNQFLSQELRKQASACVVKLLETNADGDVDFIGSFTYLTPEGVGITSLHCVHHNDAISEDSLRVSGDSSEEDMFEVEHLMSYQYHDISFYKVQGLKDKIPCMKLGTDAMLVQGQDIWLVSFTTLDSQEHPFDLQGPDIVKGQIVKVTDTLINGHYLSFPGCSGGMVMNSQGYVLGIHIGKDYYEDHSGFKPYCDEEVMADVVIKCLDLQSPPFGKFDDAEVDELAHFSALNVEHKDGYGLFIPVSLIKAKLHEEGIIKRKKKKVHISSHRRTRGPRAKIAKFGN